MATKYRVTAPVVICKAATSDGIRWIDLQRGAVVPDGTDPAWIAGHLEKDMIAVVPGTEPKAEPKPEPKAEPEPPKAADPKPAAHPRGTQQAKPEG